MPLAGNTVNVCGLFRSETTVPELARRWRDWLGVLRARCSGYGWRTPRSMKGPSVQSLDFLCDLAVPLRAGVLYW